jgi:hypothetical protein
MWKGWGYISRSIAAATNAHPQCGTIGGHHRATPHANIASATNYFRRSPMRRKPHYIVICKRDGMYVLATSRHFSTFSDAQLYTASLAITREPIIVMID